MNKDEQKAYNAAYYELNGRSMREKARARYQAQKEERAAQYQAERVERSERLRLEREGARGDQLREGQRRRYADNPGPAIARANKRRAIQHAAGLGTDREDYRAFVKHVKTAKKLACHWCKRDVPPKDRRIDHIVPLSRGGRDDVANLCCACHPCNARKHDKLPEEWDATYEPDPTGGQYL